MSTNIEIPSGRPPLHAVQFYEREEFLYETVADFLSKGLDAGEPAVVIATAEHQNGFAEALRARGFDLGAAEVLFLDARQTLESFMRGATPDGDTFRSTIGAILEPRHGGRVRAYGEMVDLLWRDGNRQGALRLEELWNDLAEFYPFTLLCAYGMGNFSQVSDGPLFDAICHTHTRSTPTERYVSAADDDARSAEITRLQQRAFALEHEIEHRKELERALREALEARRAAEEDLRDFFDNAVVALHWVGADGTILYANDAELKLLGYTREEYLGRHIADFHADQDVIADIMRRLQANEELHSVEARLVAKDGSIRHVLISTNALFRNGELVHTRCFTRDISDRKRLEDDNAFLLEAATMLHQSLDCQSRVRDLTALAVPRLADWCAVDLVRDDGSPERASESGTPQETNDGERTMIVPMQVADRVVGVLHLAAAEGRPFSSADRHLAKELARRAAIAVENARLYQAAQTANRTKDEFLATLSHELRTPLTAIFGWARMLAMGGLSPETMRTAVETIERSAKTQADLIDDLLDLSRVVTGKLTLQREVVDVGAAVAGAVQTLQLAAQARAIAIEVREPAERSVIHGDATRLQQIVWNLLSNAIKFSPAGGVVSVDAERSGHEVSIVVRDRGRGITPEFLPHVFEPFRQADSTSTRTHGGLGLGLAIVKYLAELHGGSVRAESEGEGRGATFAVTLPLA